MKNLSNEALKIAEDIQRELVERGYIVHRYDAYTTNSIYLKVDYGLAHSIRIADHEGKRYLAYRYNIRGGIRKYSKTVTKNNHIKYFFPFKDYKNVLKFIDREIILLKNKHGDEWYAKKIQKYEEDEKSGALRKNKGFWRSAFRVN